jgi:hypothetical protein
VHPLGSFIKIKEELVLLRRSIQAKVAGKVCRIRQPFSHEWNTTQLPAERRSYLDGGVSFEGMVSRVLTEMQIIRVSVKPYDMPPPGEAENARRARQIIFLFRVADKTCDLLFNAPDGLRGRYWQSPDHGAAATKYLIGILLAQLVSFAEQNPPMPGKAAPMNLADIKASLQAPPAKTWPREPLLVVPADRQLIVPRWQANEERAQFNKGMWRQSPQGDELEIKGALLGLDRTEYVPPGKKDRSCQIHYFGFT